MATPEALTKYYDCLKDSFNKIQVKDNKTALVNAALRPKIREELAKSKEVLVSYLNYIQVFTSIYSDKFNNICFSVICPLFKENSIASFSANNNNQDTENSKESNEDVAELVHKTVKEILKAKPELIEEYIHCIIKFFPSLYSDDRTTFTNYFENSLEICSYIRGEPLTSLAAKILDRVNPPTITLKDQGDEEKSAQIKKCISESYELIYQRLDSLEKRQLENVSAAILAAFTREFLTSEYEDSLNYLILHISSLDAKLTDLLINLLWAAFTNTNRPPDERRASVCFACSFMSRATFVELDKVFNYLETAVIWCKDFLFESQAGNFEDATFNGSNETVGLFYALVQSILYLITQRYRELYEKESIEKLRDLDLDKILDCRFKPLDYCDINTEQRFHEVATLYGISALKPIDKIDSVRKKRKSLNEPARKFSWKTPFKETNQSIPEHVRHLYRNYYDHRNFTILRE